MKMHRQEHPNPQWERADWKNLNGKWEFDFDFGRSARERKLYEQGALSKEINVPFCPESMLSGIGYTDFMAAVCYRKVFELSKEEAKKNIVLHFGAVDYESFVYINGQLVKTHIGGYSSFEVDITKYVKVGENTIFVIAEDDVRSRQQPSGKQSGQYYSEGCAYTRTTGIWQTVWLEFLPDTYIRNAKYYSDIHNETLTIIGNVRGSGEVCAKAFFEGNPMGIARVKASNSVFSMQIKLSELHLWEPGKGGLYDLELTFVEDNIKSYFGMRSVHIDGTRFLLNNKPVFQRFVLDQGYYPDGIYTAKSDDELKRDIVLSMELGFNGARLHQKIFEKRFLYHCDKAGYMVWCEHANWGMNYTDIIAAENFIGEWLEILERDFNHPSIIGWCPFNETWGYEEKKLKNTLIENVYKLTKQFDPTRLCIDTSGFFHTVTDIFDVHDYEQDVDRFKENCSKITESIENDQIEEMDNWKAVFISEYGGIQWSDNVSNGWGYGNAPKSKEDFLKRYKGLANAILDNPRITGFCYTQLYDVEQEQNGLYTYEREAKFDADSIRTINARKAAIEQ